MKKEVYLVFSLGTILLISSCSFPHWFVSHRHVTVEAAVGNAPEIVQVRETMVRKSSFSIEQYFRSKTLNVSEKSFSVSYQGKQIQPKVYASFPNEKYSRRLKELTTIPSMTFCKQTTALLSMWKYQRWMRKGMILTGIISLSSINYLMVL